jgi:hypothetical protein
MVYIVGRVRLWDIENTSILAVRHPAADFQSSFWGEWGLDQSRPGKPPGGFFVSIQVRISRAVAKVLCESPGEALHAAETRDEKP